MSELRRLWIPGPAGRLEALLRVACPARAAAVLAHPHPRYGGTMHNPVIFHSDRELHRAGWTTLRFNFRGVETSEGIHDGDGGEVDDVAAAAAWLRGVAVGLPLVVVGYSFGSWCGLRHALADPTVAAVVAIGLPVRLYDFDVQRLGRPIAAVQGSEDQFGSPDEVRSLLERGDPRNRLFVIDGAPHLFPGRAREVATKVVEAARGILPAAVSPEAGQPRLRRL